AAFLYAKPAERFYGRAIGLVVACLENELHPELRRDLAQRPRHFPRELLTLDHARPEDEKRVAGAEGVGADRERSAGGHLKWVNGLVDGGLLGGGVPLVF